MSTSAISSSLVNQVQGQQYFQTRASDLRQLGQALSSGDLSGAQTAFNNLVALGQSGPSSGGNVFKVSQREQDFNHIGNALQSGNLAAAQEAFGNLAKTFQAPTVDPLPSSAASTSGPEVVLNISNSSGSANPEQITINIANSANGGEQLSLSVGNQGSNPQQVTFNLPANSNEQIVLNLLGAPASSSSSGSSSSASTPNGGLSVSA
jgi:hypothetical protein